MRNIFLLHKLYRAKKHSNSAHKHNRKPKLTPSPTPSPGPAPKNWCVTERATKLPLPHPITNDWCNKTCNNPNNNVCGNTLYDYCVPNPPGIWCATHTP